jgi:ABC-2 type transport system permease protein
VNSSAYWALLVAAIRSKMEYRATFIFFLFALIFFYAAQIGVVLVVMSKFKSINGWSIGEMAFLFGLLSFSQGVTMLLFSPLNNFEGFIIQGNFDRLLTRPLNPLLQTLVSGFEVSSLAHFLIGSAGLWFGSHYAGVQWTGMKLFFLALVIIGAAMIQGGIRLAVSAVAFWTIRNRSLVHTIVYSSKEFVMYPITIYNLWIQVFLTIVFPLAFINFYPSHYFLARDSSLIILHPFLQYLTPVVGVITFGLAYALWIMGINRYQSVGN